MRADRVGWTCRYRRGIMKVEGGRKGAEEEKLRQPLPFVADSELQSWKETTHLIHLGLVHPAHNVLSRGSMSTLRAFVSTSEGVP
jgi:hypothetical protein